MSDRRSGDAGGASHQGTGGGRLVVVAVLLVVFVVFGLVVRVLWFGGPPPCLELPLGDGANGATVEVYCLAGAAPAPVDGATGGSAGARAGDALAVERGVPIELELVADRPVRRLQLELERRSPATLELSGVAIVQRLLRPDGSVSVLLRTVAEGAGAGEGAGDRSGGGRWRHRLAVTLTGEPGLPLTLRLQLPEGAEDEENPR